MNALDSNPIVDGSSLVTGQPFKANAAHGIRRGAATWYCYLLFGLLTYLLTIQGNVIPFLQSELHLSYRAVSFHSSAIAAGMIVVGLFGERISRWLGRRKTLSFGAGGMAVGAVLLCLAPEAWASIASCGFMGLLGAMIPSIVPALLADIHGDRRDAAFAEATGVSYAFGILAPLGTSLLLWLAFSWRYAVILGAVYGGFLVFRFGQIPLPEPVLVAPSARRALSPAYWAYWCLLVASIALEFCVLLWAPAYLERVAGFATTSAAAIAAGFSVGMLTGRLATGWLVRTISPRFVFLAALLVACLGFGIYWGINEPLAGVAGIFVLGLGIAPLYPLTLGFAIGAAGQASDAASARFMLGVGLAILVAPAVLGDLADRVGLRMAHLTLPVLVAAALACFAMGQILEHRKGAEYRISQGTQN
jgi:fucose permease